MPIILWKPWEGAFFFPCTSLPCGKLSQHHSIILSAFSSTTSLDVAPPSQRCSLGCFKQPTSSAFADTRAQRVGQIVVVPPLLWHRRGGSQEKVNQRALLNAQGNWDTVASSRCWGKEVACSRLHRKNFLHSSLTSLDFSLPSTHVTTAVQTCLSERAESP